MKKIIIALLSLMTVSAMATETAYVGIKLTGKTTAASTNYKIRITEDSQYANGYVDGEEAEILNFTPSNSNSVFLYALVGTHKCSSIYETTISNMPMGFQTNRVDNEYTLTFTTVEGRPLKLLDKVTNSIITIEADGTYDFEVNADNCPGFVVGQNKLIEDRFVIEPILFHDRAVAAGNWGTICYPELITSVEGAVVYEIAGRNADATEIVAAEVAVADMMAGKPYLFNATADAQKFYYNPNETTSLQAGANGLTGTFEQTTLGTDGYYVVKGQSFIPALGSSAVLANRAYLALTDITQMDVYQEIAGVNVRRFSVVRGATTGNGNVNADMNANGKYIMNGRFVIIREGQEYNALGF